MAVPATDPWEIALRLPQKNLRRQFLLPLLLTSLLAACGGAGSDDGPIDTAAAASVGTRNIHTQRAGASTASSSAADASDGRAEALAMDAGAQADVVIAAATRPFPHHTTYTAGVIKPTNVSQSTMDS